MVFSSLRQYGVISFHTRGKNAPFTVSLTAEYSALRFMWVRLALFERTMPEHNEAKKRLHDHYEKTFINA
ncbi:hypothetical protein ALP29_201828 [Pseudomonas syringae pv. avii]|nr:hypothetical protein ALP29_201828 [Pseudomonas syringae pv. avii]